MTSFSVSNDNDNDNEESKQPTESGNTSFMDSFKLKMKNKVSSQPSDNNKNDNKFMKLFKKKEDPIECKQCSTEHFDINKNKFCYNCGYCLSVQIAKTPSTPNKSKDKKLRKKLVLFSKKRYDLVTEYHKQCIEMDKIIIDFIEHKIKIEQEYIGSNQTLTRKFSKNVKTKEAFTSTLSQTLLIYTETMTETTNIHSNYLLFLQSILVYVRSENAVMLDFLNEFQTAHSKKLNDIWLQWRDNEYLLDSHKIMNDKYEETKKEIWNEWQTYLKQSLKSFPIFMKMRYKKIVKRVFVKIMKNEIDINHQKNEQYFNVWSTINGVINEFTEIELFMEYYKNTEWDTLDSLIQSLGFETRNSGDIESMELDNTALPRKSDNILERTRRNGIEWFSPLLFSEKGRQKWDLSESEWNLVIFEQILCEIFMIKDQSCLDTQDIRQISIDCIRAQFEVSKNKLDELININIYKRNKSKYKLNTLCHRIFTIDMANVDTHFSGDAKEYNHFIRRQLSFILSCVIWSVLESKRNFWNVSGVKHNKADLLQSLHANCDLVKEFCKQKCDQNNENNAGKALFSPIKHLMLEVQEIAAGLNETTVTDMNVPNAIYQKIYIEITNQCFVENQTTFLDELELESSGSDPNNNIKKAELNESWTKVADLLFILSQKSFMISINFHCFAFLELIFDRIIDNKDSETTINPLLLIQPNTNEKDKVLLKIIEETFRILMDDVDDKQRSQTNKFQEDVYIHKVIENIENKLSLWLSDYKDCDTYTISKFFIFFIFIKKIKHKHTDFSKCYDKLVQFTLITATQICSALEYDYCPNIDIANHDDHELQLKLQNVHTLHSFRIDFLRILHDQMRWHSDLDKLLKEHIAKVNSDNCILINNFNNNHTETFLLQWISKFSHLENETLQQLKHHDIDQDFLSLVDEINQFILISTQYKNRISIENRRSFYDTLPQLNKICVFKFKEWTKSEIEPIFKRCIDNVIKNETWNAPKAAHGQRKSSLGLFLLSQKSVMSAAVNEQLLQRSSSTIVHTGYVSDFIIDLCTLTDSMTSGCLSFLSSLKLYDFNDSKPYWKVLQRQLCRISEWVTCDINKQISLLVPAMPILSINVMHKKDKSINKIKEKMDIFAANTEAKKQEMKLKALAIKMHSLDFVLSSLNHTKVLIEEQYHKFISKDFGTESEEYLHREVMITLDNCNVSEFLLQNFAFIPLKCDEKRGFVVSNIKRKSIKYEYEMCIGFQLIEIGDDMCENESFDTIMDWITNDYNEIFEEFQLKFRFNVKGVISALFFDMFETYNASLKSIASLISHEIVYNSLYKDLFEKLYNVPLHENRLSDLQIATKLFKICDPFFEFVNDKNFGLIIHHIFDRLLECIGFILTANTSQIATKPWIKNDYGLIKQDISDIIRSFEADIDKKYIEHKCVRIYNILTMIKLSTPHLTQHSLPELLNYKAHCLHNHVLYECLVNPEQMSNYKSNTNRKNDAIYDRIKCIDCRLYINIKCEINEIGYYFCGNDTCLKDNVFYCANCYNKVMYAQNVKGNISKFDVISMLSKKKNENNSKQFAIKYVQNQCVRSQIKRTFQEKEWKRVSKIAKKEKKIAKGLNERNREIPIDNVDLP